MDPIRHFTTATPAGAVVSVADRDAKDMHAAKRCRAHLSDGSGQKCKAPALVGTDVCRVHGGSIPAVKRKSQKVKAERELTRFTTPIPLDDPLANPAYALHEDFRRTMARIRWLEQRISRMTADDLTFGLTKEERINASETPGVNKTYEARLSVYEELLSRERGHLLKVTDLMAKQSFRAAELALQTQARQFVFGSVMDIVRAMGRDPASPKVRQRLLEVFGDPAVLKELPSQS